MATPTPAFTRGLGYVRNPKRLSIPALSLPFATSAPLPASVDLRHYFLPAFDQGQYSTCTCNAAASQLEYQLVRDHVSVPYHRSRSMPYYYSGVLEGDTGDVGRDPVDVYSAMNLHGDCPEQDWPYYPASAIGQVPSALALKAATRRKFLRWHSVAVDVQAAKQALAYGYSVGIALTICRSFMQASVLSSGLIPLPHARDHILGGHFMVLGGYADVAVGDIPAAHFLVLNSWGNVGHNGWFYLPFEALSASAPGGQAFVPELLALEQVTP